MAAGLLSGVSDFLFGNVDNQQYLQQYAQQQVEAEKARQREAQAYAAQQRYGQYLQAVMNGTAPSMAQLQLQQGLGAIQQNQQSMAAGIGGAGQALAQYGAAQNIGNAQTATNQAAALARVQEQGQARQLYGTNAQGLQQASANLYNSNSQNALGYAQVASGNAIGETNQRNSMQGTGALLQGLGQAGASYFGRQPDTSSDSGS